MKGSKYNDIILYFHHSRSQSCDPLGQRHGSIRGAGQEDCSSGNENVFLLTSKSSLSVRALSLRTVPTNSKVFLPRFMIMQEM